MFKRAGLKPKNNENKYISSGVGAMNISNRRALYRRAAQSHCCTEKKSVKKKDNPPPTTGPSLMG